MQIRKLVKSGYASLVVAVPKDWLTRNKLKAGDLVYINDDNNLLTIGAEPKGETKAKGEIVINIDGKDEMIILRELNTAYMNNVKHIILRGKELNKHAKYIKSAISGLIALELVDESSERIVARSFLNIPDIDIKTLVRRVDNILRSMMIDTKESLNDPSLADSVIDRDKEVNKLNNLLAKVIKSGFTDKEIQGTLKMSDLDLLRYWELTGHMEKIGDRTKNIASIAKNLKDSRKERFLKLFSSIEKIYLESMKSFYDFNQKLSDHVSLERRKVLIDITKYIEESKSTICSQIAINAYNLTAHINHIGRIVRYLD
ncbi:phosphate uptake regulator PhoU [Candidatus Woesearchaeota archaeon]|nr:phosphate uptake regulator PhoU [Candidatus Woesearchaeota archaeon]